MQTRLKELPKLKRSRANYPQVNVFTKEDYQKIELNRGCKRKCFFCYADPNYKQFSIPKMERNLVQIIGEGFLYDNRHPYLLNDLGNLKCENKVVRYALSQGIDFRILLENPSWAEILKENRFGYLTRSRDKTRAYWQNGLRIAWDWGKEHEKDIKKTIDLLEKVGYERKKISVFILSLCVFKFDLCLYKLSKLRKWNVKVDDCTYNTTKKQLRKEIRMGVWFNKYWTMEEYEIFRHKCRKHNQFINFGYDPELKIKEH